MKKLNINVQSIWLSEKDAETLLVDVIQSHKPSQLLGSDRLYTLKVEIAKRLKETEAGRGKQNETLGLWLIFEAPLDEVLEYIDEPNVQEIILWRMNNNIPAQNELRKQQERDRYKKINQRKYTVLDPDRNDLSYR